MELYVELDVKFRAFGITFGSYSHAWNIPLPAPAPFPASQLLQFSGNGIHLSIALENAS